MGAEANATWLVDKGGYEATYCCLNATLRDFARFGMLLANYGALDGKQIIPAGWVKAATTPEAPHLAVGTATKYNGYGYQTWISIKADRADVRRVRPARPGHLRRPARASSSSSTPPSGPTAATRPSAAPSSSSGSDPARKDFTEEPMTYVAKPKLHHPTLPKNKLGYTRRDYEGKVSTLCAGCGHDSISRRADRGLLGARHPAAPRRQALRHRLQLQDARLLPGQLARLQHRPRPHALGPDRRQPRQPRADLPRRLAATATPPRSASASSPTSCAAA